MRAHPQVMARDDDLGENGQVSYMLSEGNGAGVFNLTSDGHLSVTRSLDRETQEMYTLIITASDSGMSACNKYYLESCVLYLYCNICALDVSTLSMFIYPSIFQHLS